MINAALPLYVWERREDGGEPGSISIPPVLLQESALSLYRCSAAFQITEKTHQTLQFGFTPSTPPPPTPSCLLLPYETNSCIQRVSSGVRLHLLIKYWLRRFSKLVKTVSESAVVRLELFYCVFGGQRKADWFGRDWQIWVWSCLGQTLKLIMYLNPSCYARLPKAFEGIIWSGHGRVSARHT